MVEEGTLKYAHSIGIRDGPCGVTRDKSCDAVKGLASAFVVCVFGVTRWAHCPCVSLRERF